MQTAILQAMEVGFHQVPFHLESPLCYLFWSALLVGALVQHLLLRKTGRRAVRWAFAGALLAGLLGCEIACQVITGWELLLPLFLYCLLLTLLLGAALRLTAAWFQRRA